MALDGTIIIDGRPFTLVADSQLPSGKRAYVKELRPSQPTDPSRLGEVMWEVSGPLGVSREGRSGYLGVDYADNLETRFDDLLTSAPTATTITLTTLDPAGLSISAALGALLLGATPLGGGTDIGPGHVTHIDEQSERLFFHRHDYSTQVDTGWSVEATYAQGATVAGVENWKDFGWVSFGDAKPLSQRVTVTGAGSSYIGVSSGGSAVYAGDLRKGNDRLWMVKANTNQAQYTLDEFVALSNAFDVGDSGQLLTGIGTLGPLTVFGAADGVFSFTDSGKPVRVNDALRGHRSPYNGARHASQWGWDYYTTDFGLYAWAPNVNNPVGPEAEDGFEGPIDGRPVAIHPWRELLLVSYLTPSGDTYIILGKFGSQTAGTGKPDWYPFLKFTGVSSEAIWATSLHDNPTLLFGYGTNAKRVTMGRRGRDIADTNYSFGITGGQWFGTTMTRAQSLHKYLRHVSLQTENCTSIDYWQLAVSCDGDAYVNVGNSIIDNGHHIVRPSTGGGPKDSVSFHTIKPRLTQVSTNAITPPQVRGKITLSYDERPDMISEVKASLLLRTGDMGFLETAVGHDTEFPMEVSLPGDREKRYGFVTSVGPITDLKGNTIQAAQISLVLWDA